MRPDGGPPIVYEGRPAPAARSAWILGGATLALLGLAWEAVTRLGWVPALFLPAPTAVLAEHDRAMSLQREERVRARQRMRETPAEWLAEGDGVERRPLGRVEAVDGALEVEAVLPVAGLLPVGSPPAGVAVELDAPDAAADRVVVESQAFAAAEGWLRSYTVDAVGAVDDLVLLSVDSSVRMV